MMTADTPAAPRRRAAPAGALRALLSGIVDYAGLFPPAALPMDAAVRQYAAYRTGPDAWMLGRFVVPAARLPELQAAAAPVRAQSQGDEESWPLSVLVGTGDEQALDALARLAAGQAGAVRPLRAAAAEAAADEPGAIGPMVERLRHQLPDAELYVEIPLDRDPAPLVAAIAAAGARAKARTGGVTPNAIPSSEAVARFLVACVEAHVPYKATAGLHHPVRGEHALTYEDGAPRATMHGFLNVFLAGALLRAGGSTDDARALLDEQDAAAIAVDDAGIHWRGHTFDAVHLGSARRLAAGFGSCSFEEPIGDLRALGML